MNIDITKNYKYRNGEPARILCVDAPGHFPIRSMSNDGNVHKHRGNGSTDRYDDWQLVVVEEEWRELGPEEIIREGDELLDESRQAWIPCELTVGDSTSEHPRIKFRRRVSPAPSANHPMR